MIDGKVPMSKYGAFKKKSIPVPFNRSCFLFLMKSYWYETSGDLVSYELPEEWTSGL